MRRPRIPPMLHALLVAPSVLLMVSLATPDSPALPVRFPEGMVHGFLELRTATDRLLAHGDLLQVPGDSGIDSRLVFHFPDSSVFTETVRFTQHKVFALRQYHLVQRGPAFAHDLDVQLSGSGRYDVTSRSRKDGEVKRYTGTLDLPADVYNGMVIMIAKNLAAQRGATVHVVAFTPKPRLIRLAIEPAGSRPVTLGQHTETAVEYAVKPKLGPVVRAVAELTGQAPPDSRVWIVRDDVPAFVRFEGPLYSGPVWRIILTSPRW